MRDVLELLRNFLRAKALTESEISREVRAHTTCPSARGTLLIQRVSPCRRSKAGERRMCALGQVRASCPVCIMFSCCNR